MKRKSSFSDRELFRLGQLVDEFGVLEAMRRQTMAINRYLEAALSKDVTVELAAEVWLANKKAIKALDQLVASRPTENA